MAESPLARCLKCGSPLPPAGECPTCAARAGAGASAQPAVLGKDLNLDRRKERAAAAQIPSFDQLTTRQPARAAPPPPPPTGYKPSSIPPGMAPKRTASSPQASSADPSAGAAPAVAPLPPRRAGVDPATQVTQPAPKVAAQVPAPRAPAAPSAPVTAPQPAAPGRRTTQDDLIAQHLAPSATAGPVRTAEPRQREVRAAPAPLWRRLLAFAIDAALILGVAALFLVIATTVAGVKAPQTQFRGFDRLITYAVAFESVLKPTAALAVILALLYTTAFAFIWDGRTVGRRLLGIQLVDGTGFPPSPARAAARSALSLLSFAVFLGGFWLALFDRRGQTLHDKLTGTFVIHRK